MTERKDAVTTEVVWRDLHQRLLSFLRSRVRNDADAEDILQDVFTRIHENAHRLEEVESLTGWIYRIARNALIDFHRAQARRQVWLLDEGTAELAVAAAEAEAEPDAGARAGVAQCITPLLARLPDEYGVPLALTELEGLSQKLAAERMGLSLSAMKSRVSRGRSKLKDLLLDCCHIELDRRRGVASVEARASARSCACECGPS